MMAKGKKRTILLLIACAACVFAVSSWAYFGCASSEEEPDVEDVRGVEEVKEVKENRGFAEAQRLAGQWVRPDGGYRLVIEDIKPDGRLEASYYNPRKINVHEANWKYEDNKIHLFIELRDINYPGSKYTLVYSSERNTLEGTYFQAVAKETYFVKFIKVPEAQN